MLFLYLIAVIVMAEKFAIPLDNFMERLGMPQAFGGAIVAEFGPRAGGIGGNQGGHAKSTPAIGQHPARLGACVDRPNDSGGADHWNGDTSADYAGN